MYNTLTMSSPGTSQYTQDSASGHLPSSRHRPPRTSVEGTEICMDCISKFPNNLKDLQNSRLYSYKVCQYQSKAAYPHLPSSLDLLGTAGTSPGCRCRICSPGSTRLRGFKK